MIAEHVVRQAEPPGVVSDERAVWLLAHVDECKSIEALAALVNVLRRGAPRARLVREPRSRSEPPHEAPAPKPRCAQPPDSFPSIPSADRLAGADRARYRIATAANERSERGRDRGDLGMTKAAASLMAAAVLAARRSFSAEARSKLSRRPIRPSGSTGWSARATLASAAFRGPDRRSLRRTLRPTYGCYFTRARLKNAWREVEVCS